MKLQSSSQQMLNRWNERDNRPIQTEAAKKYAEQHVEKQDAVKSKKQAQKEQWEAELQRELEYQRSLQQRGTASAAKH